ncbi:MAG: ral secretory system protein domain protein [Rhodospirillales bacterium]|nr:ral secretory system protein domain protein [Rhodospirillales bacterium]
MSGADAAGGSMLFAQYVLVLEWATLFVGLVILLSSLDDAFIDACYWLRAAYRTVFLEPRIQPLPIAALRDKPEQKLAIMVPAWKESDVIAQMIENTIATIEYADFKIFCGSYANDPATIEEIERMARRYRQVVHVRVPHDGPTCKADCLNWIVQAIFLDEQKTGRPFAGMVLHDSEDVIHPLELRLFNLLLPRKDLIQLPVYSLEREWWQLVAGCYMDDFAEWHSKDLVVRESLTGLVPCAGVGTCFSLQAIRALCAGTENRPFNISSLTEDYDFSFRLKALGMKQVFVRFPIRHKSWRTRFIDRARIEVEVDSYVAVREYFPSTFRTAVRQRSRWILGIAFQGWLDVAWKGSLWNKYMLVRDRKGVITSIVSILAYLLALNYAGIWAAEQFDLGLKRWPSLLDDPLISALLEFNLLLLTNRIVQRFYFVSRAYGWRQGAMAIARVLVNNLINFFATLRAWKQFTVFVMLDKRIAWDKTDHVFPSTEQLTALRRRLGELLLAWKALDETQLEQALAAHAASGERLGAVLLREGWLREDTLADAIAHQEELPRRDLDLAQLDAASLPVLLAIRHRVVPVGRTASGALELLAAEPLDDAARAALAPYSVQPPVVAIARDSEIRLALRRLTGDAANQNLLDPRVPLLGDLLVADGALRRADLAAAIGRFDPARDGRFGRFLCEQGLIDAAQLDRALAQQQARAAGFAPVAAQEHVA